MKLETILKEKGKNRTKEREELFLYMQEKRLFSAKDILALFSQQLGRATVFRTIKLFLDLGIIRRIQTDEKGEIYEVNTLHHQEYMRCYKCKKIIAFESEKICNALFKEAKKQGFFIKEHSLNIAGLCEKCQ